MDDLRGGRGDGEGALAARRAQALRRALTALALLALAAAACGESPARGAHASPEAVQPLAAGDRVPSATVRDVSGEAVDLASLVAERGALLVFYRGGW
jgi:hypothetical protein